LTYKIDEPELFFKNVYVEDVRPGQDYFEVIKSSITELLESLVEDAVVTAMVNYTIDEALRSTDRIPNHVRRLVQDKLDSIDSGIKVISVQLDDITWPRQVEDAFLASHRANQASQRLVKEAQAEAEKMLSEAAGPVAVELYEAIVSERTPPERMEYLWSQLAGAAQEEIDLAKAYRTKVVESAKANARYLKELLPEYQKRPRLVIQKIYQDAIQQVLANADEKMIIQPTRGTGQKEIRILLNRDPTIKKEAGEQE